MEKTNLIQEAYPQTLTPIQGKLLVPDKTPLVKSWFRSHVASVSATAADFLVTILLTELAGIWYLLSNMLGASVGGVISFTMCRRWVFNRRTPHMRHQAFRFSVAVVLSMMLNSWSVWFLTEAVHFPYILSKICAAILIGVSINFMVFRYFVFK